MTVTPLGRDQDCSLKIREPDVPASWFLDPGGWSKTTAVGLYFIFPGICTLSLELFLSDLLSSKLQHQVESPQTTLYQQIIHVVDDVCIRALDLYGINGLSHKFLAKSG
ncbi:hypothetical protein STEG23_024176 [Scotinomys teguina]